jgi:hypothetical protein
MSSITIPTNPALLHKIIALCQAELAGQGEIVPIKATKTKKAPKEKAEKKPKGTGAGTAYAAWTAEMMAKTWPAEKEAYTAARIAAAEAGELLYTGEEKACKDGKHAAGDAFSVEEAKQGVHLAWMSAHKKANAADYEAFVAEWKEAHPKDASGAASVASGAASVADGEESVAGSEKAEKKVGRKKLVDMTPAEKAKHDAGVATRKAAKAAKALAEEKAATEIVPPAPKAAAPAPKAAEPKAAEPKAEEPKPKAEEALAAEPKAEEKAEEPEADDEEEAPTPRVFKFNTVKYFRYGTETDEAKIQWFSADLWTWTAKGRGSYVGCIEDGVLNCDADEPEWAC